MRALFGIVAVVIAAAFVAADSHLPEGFIGHWQGQIDYSPMGPLMFPFNFSILPVDGTDGTMWLMADAFDGYLGTSSTQQFWVASTVVDGNITTTNNTYCGVLNNFFGMNEDVQVILFESQRTNDTMQWNLGANQFPFGGQWTLTLSANGSTLRSHYQMPTGEVEHIDVTYNRRQPDEALQAGLPSSIPKPSWVGLSAPCTNSKAAKPEAAKASTSQKRGCPFGFSSSKRREMESQALAVEAAKGRRTVTPYADTFQYCYLINPAMEYTVRWNYNVPTQTIDVLFSGKPMDGSDPAGWFVALGIYPNWPAMQGMDIILGHFAQEPNPTTGHPDACVRPMYAKHYVGAPFDNENQTLTNKTLWTENGRLYVGFTRPWVTGYHDINRPPSFEWVIPGISFAMGQAASNCTSRPHYHYNHRGSYGFWWSKPSVALPDHMKCQ